MIRGLMVQQGANGNTPWFPVDADSLAFWVGLMLSSDFNANLVATVQHTMSQLSTFHKVSWSQTGTTVTVTDLGIPSPPVNPASGLYAGHGLQTGDSTVIQASGFPTVVDSQGQPSITVTGKTTYTYTAAGSQSATGIAQACNIRVRNNQVLAALATPIRSDSNYNTPVSAIRLNVSSWVAGAALLEILQGRGVGG